MAVIFPLPSYYNPRGSHNNHSVVVGPFRHSLWGVATGNRAPLKPPVQRMVLPLDGKHLIKICKKHYIDVTFFLISTCIL